MGRLGDRQLLETLCIEFVSMAGKHSLFDNAGADCESGVGVDRHSCSVEKVEV